MNCRLLTESRACDNKKGGKRKPPSFFKSIKPVLFAREVPVVLDEQVIYLQLPERNGKYKITGIVGIAADILLPPFQIMQTETFPAEFKVPLVTYLLPGHRTGIKRRIGPCHG